MYTRELIDIQYELEAEMRAAASTRFHNRHNKALDLLLEAVDKENNTVIDPYLTNLLSLKLAFA